MSSNGTTSHFQTPIRGLNPNSIELSGSAFETPKTTNIVKMIDQVKEKPDMDENLSKNDENMIREEATKIKFVEQGNDEQNYHTPISFKMNKFIMCFKSEPDLSRVQSANQNEPVLNRGRFIAKKLLGGVSMVNLRRPFASATDKITISSVKKSTKFSERSENDSSLNAHKSTNQDETDCNKQLISSGNEQIIDKTEDDDEDFIDDEEVDREYDESIDKENESPDERPKTLFIEKMKSNAVVINCDNPFSASVGNDSVSPITKSTHRMSKAMQVCNYIELKLHSIFYILL